MSTRLDFTGFLRDGEIKIQHGNLRVDTENVE